MKNMKFLSKLVCLAVLLGLVVSLIGVGRNPVGASSDTTPPKSFYLLSPENGETIWDLPASYKQPFMADQLRWCQEHGVHFSDDVVTLEWEASSDAESGLDHYEVWIDGRNVENVPPENTSYTTMVGQSLAHPHEWHVVAVDKVGNERRSETFEFWYRLCYTPPMGFNTWTSFHYLLHGGVSEGLMKGIADAMVSSGMKDVGYEFVNLDDCWTNAYGQPMPSGGPVPQPCSDTFPSGMKALADYIHGKGLKFGIYSRSVKEGLWDDLVDLFVSWGVDYWKCEFTNVNKVVGGLVENCGRPIVLSTFRRGEGNLWRTCGDLYAGQWNLVMRNLDAQIGLSEDAGPGGWNDPDMLAVGISPLTITESKSHFSLWSIVAAPLIAANDLRDMDSDTRDILTNGEVIAVDQDPRGIQGKIVAHDPDNNWQVWARPLFDGGVAVVLFNRSKVPRNITVEWSEIGLASEPAWVRDLWEHRGLGVFENSFTAYVEPHGVVMVKIMGVSLARFEYSNLSVSKSTVEPGENLTVSVVVTNTGGESGPCTVELSIDGQTKTEEVTLDPGASETVTFDVSMDDEGTYQVSVGELTDSFEVVSIPGAEFVVENLEISPENVAPGEEVTISVDVANIGEVADSTLVELKIDGEVVDNQVVLLISGESKPVSFTVVRDEPGSYAVDVEGLTGSFEVAGPEEGEIPWVPVAAGVIVVIAVIGILAYKRRK